MVSPFSLIYHPEVALALKNGGPVVALESTVITHGLPWPLNLETAREMEDVIHGQGAVPATIAVWEGKPAIGLKDDQLKSLARNNEVVKASRRDLCTALAQGKTAGTTVAATMLLAHLAGIRVFATGGIGGAHPPQPNPWDISADLYELGRTPVAVVCAGAKSILDIPRTLEILESYSVPVLGFRTADFPGFYLRTTGEIIHRVDSVEELAKIVQIHWGLQGKGLLITQPIEEKFALEISEWKNWLHQAESKASQQAIKGKFLTPFLLAEIVKSSQGKSLEANRALLVANARLAAELARTIVSAKG